MYTNQVHTPQKKHTAFIRTGTNDQWCIGKKSTVMLRITTKVGYTRYGGRGELYSF